MTVNQSLPAPDFKRIPASTEGEVKKWLHTESVGNTPFAATYLANLRSLQEYAAQFEKDDPAMVASVIGLAAIIADRSESRSQDVARLNGGRLPVEIEGIEPLHTVHDEDIEGAVAEIVPDELNGEHYIHGDSMLQAHGVVMMATEHHLGQTTPPDPAA